MAEELTDEELEKALAQFPSGLREELRADYKLSRELRDTVLGFVERLQTGGEISNEEFVNTLNEIARKHGNEYGIPMPDVYEGHHFVGARRVPLTLVYASQVATEHALELAFEGAVIRNSWERLGDCTISIVNTEEGPRPIRRWHAGTRMRKLIHGLGLRIDLPNMSAEAELKAMETLKLKIGDTQWRSYVLNGAFLEKSKRSGLHYLFRKGLPTLAMSYHGDKNEGGRMLAALCLHPVGYYAGTHVGAMPPTDEVIAHLLFMRADEHKFWAKSGQWPPWDTRSGL